MSSILGQEDPLEEEIANHSSTLAWRIAWIEEPGGLYPWGRTCVRARTHTHTHTVVDGGGSCNGREHSSFSS